MIKMEKKKIKKNERKKGRVKEERNKSLKK